MRSEGDVEDLLSVPVLASVGSIPRNTRIVTYGRHEARFADSYALHRGPARPNQGGRRGRGHGRDELDPARGKDVDGGQSRCCHRPQGLERDPRRLRFPQARSRGDVRDSRPCAGSAAGDVRARSSRPACWTASLEGPRPQLENPEAGPAHPPKTGGARAPKSDGSLRIVPAGGETRSAPQQEQLQYLIELLRADADLVILDTPPALLAVEVAEIARLVDVVLLVVRQGRVSQRNLRNLQRQLRTWPAEVVGAVMTDVQADNQIRLLRKAMT